MFEKTSKGYWIRLPNRRNFLDKMIQNFNITVPSDWGKITTKQLEEAGGKTLLQYFDGSLFKCLQSVYSEVDWKLDWFHTPKAHWSHFQHHKIFLQNIAEKYHIKSFQDWGKITQDIILEEGGKQILVSFNSIQNMLQFHFPQVDWNPEWWNHLPSRYWKIQSNRRKFLDKIKIQFQIQQPKDWGKLTSKDVMNAGGYTLLDNYFNRSLFRCLQSVYPEIEWKKEWFHNIPNRSWKTMADKRRFLDEVKKVFKIQEPSDWGKITVSDIERAGGKTLIYEYYNGSLFKCLQSVYSEVIWRREWFSHLPKFSKMHWESMSNRREFLNQLANQYNIRSEHDWSRITNSLIKVHGGAVILYLTSLTSKGLLHRYNNSLVNILKSNFPEVQWQKESMPRFRLNHWDSLENQREFLDDIAVEYAIVNPKDWKRVTPTLIRKHGGYGLLAKHNGSLLQTLRYVYAGKDWNSLFKESNYEQDNVAKQVWGLFQDGRILHHHRHPTQVRRIKNPN